MAKQYKVFKASTSDGLEVIVNQRLQEGWKLSSGVGLITPTAISVGANKELTDSATLTLAGLNFEIIWAQAMVKNGDFMSVKDVVKLST